MWLHVYGNWYRNNYMGDIAGPGVQDVDPKHMFLFFILPTSKNTRGRGLMPFCTGIRKYRFNSRDIHSQEMREPLNPSSKINPNGQNMGIPNSIEIAEPRTRPTEYGCSGLWSSTKLVMHWHNSDYQWTASSLVKREPCHFNLASAQYTERCQCIQPQELIRPVAQTLSPPAPCSGRIPILTRLSFMSLAAKLFTISLQRKSWTFCMWKRLDSRIVP